MAKSKKKPSTNAPPEENAAPSKVDDSGPSPTKEQESIEKPTTQVEAVPAQISQVSEAIRHDPKIVERTSQEVHRAIEDAKGQVAVELALAVKAIEECIQLELRQAQGEIKKILELCQRQIGSEIMATILGSSGKINFLRSVSNDIHKVLHDALAQVQAVLKSAVNVIENRAEFELKQAYIKIKARLKPCQHRIDVHLGSVVRHSSGKLEMTKQALEQLAKALHELRQTQARPAGTSQQPSKEAPKQKHSDTKVWNDALLKTLDTVSKAAHNLAATTKPPPTLPWADASAVQPASDPTKNATPN
ncbi:hypothetical protein OC846_004934 [Tilletia horrida]|uniref:Uncharacterized protein n=1 Tax=Tilletia horrida TaxID=155126 RepID=A0AAN6GMD8_9BASI|nr:hypothetical protein OC846_004934 [Tilletia horrida]KAK0564604.1 hypothetical protein OC861_004194 [Tilletia horrida]